ncbi:MAG TPA: TolC family protein [Gemmataceae bacterium]|nr:TolC family protein [Gemmataceae bacterium]
MRWKRMIAGFALAVAAASGCKQPIYMTADDLGHTETALSDRIEYDATASYTPDFSQMTNGVITSLNPEQPPRYVTLSECIATALEQGTIGSQGIVGAGNINDSLVTFGGGAVSGSDNIRVLSLDPAIIGANIEAAEAKFDARWISNFTWNTTDRPVGTALDTFQAGGVLNSITTQAATATSTIAKPLPTGGVAGITFSVPYSFTNLPSRVNPSYTPSLQFQFEQPLLQGFGIEINELRPSHPGSLLINGLNSGSRVEGILITRIRFDQERAQFEAFVNTQLLNVETAYWNLYSSYWQLYTRDQGLYQAYQAWKISSIRLKAGKDNIADLATTRAQYETFRSQRLTALGQVLENERRLRALMGLKVNDGFRLVPADAPNLANFQPDWESGQREALTLRPELVLARQDLKFRQLDLINQKNLLLPDFRFLSTYDVNSIGNRLDGPDGNNAFRNLASDRFNNWSVGLQLNVPLGFRDANSAVRVARLNLERSYWSLKDQELKTIQILEQQRRSIADTYQQIGIQRANREANAVQVQARFQKYVIGTSVDGGGSPLVFLLQAQTGFADALASEYNFIAQYQNALVAWEFAKGTIMQYDNVSIGEGPLPNCVQVRAVENAERRSKALVVRERENPVAYQAVTNDEEGPKLPVLGEEAPALPSLMEKTPKAPTDKAGRPLPLPNTAPSDIKPASYSNPVSSSNWKSSSNNTGAGVPTMGLQPAEKSKLTTLGGDQ